jgi:hypothetical protein
VPKGNCLFYVHRYYDLEDDGFKARTALIGADPPRRRRRRDWSAAVCYRQAAIRQPNRLREDVYRRQVEVPQQARDLLAFQQRNYGARLWIEAVAGFKAVPQLTMILPGVLVGEITRTGISGNDERRQRE